MARLEDAAVFPVGTEVSVAVLDSRGRMVFDLDGGRALLPASTAKLATGAAALLLYGPDHRFATTVRATGPLQDGVLDGRLELVGGGDPALSNEDYRTLVYRDRPHTNLEDLADAIVSAGVETVTGGVVAAPDAFTGGTQAPGWKPGYLESLDARRITALTVNGGLDLDVTSEPPDPELTLVAADDPAAEATTILRRLLRERGVRLGGRVEAGGDVDRELARITSPPLRDHLRFAFERSDNHTADTLFRQVGTRLGARGWGDSGGAVARLLASAGVDTTGLRLLDGSGLSRDDRSSARGLASIDQVMRDGDLGEVWRDAQAVAGEEGTIRRRLRGTVADGRFLGKSGTLDDVTALAGTVEGPDGEPAYHVAAIANVDPAEGRFSSILVIHDLVALLAEDAAGCTRLPPPEDLPEDEPVVRGLYVTCPTTGP